MSDDRIYVRFKGKVLGPLTSNKVQELTKRGQITRMHELSSDGMAWMRAEDFGNFFPSQVATATPTQTQPQAAPLSGDRFVASGSNASAPRAGEPPEQSVEWYAHVDGENRGPIPSARLFQMIDSGDVDRDTLVWRSGFDGWRAAAQSFPEQFSDRPSVAITPEEPRGPRRRSKDVSSRTDTATNFARTQTLVRFLAISILVFSGLNVLYFVTAMVVGSESRWGVGQGSQAVVFGLTGLVTNGIVIAGAILLLRYAASLNGMLQYPEVALANASKRLRTFWQYCAVIMLILEIVFIGGAIVLVVMLAAVADSVS